MHRVERPAFSLSSVGDSLRGLAWSRHLCAPHLAPLVMMLPSLSAMAVTQDTRLAFLSLMGCGSMKTQTIAPWYRDINSGWKIILFEIRCPSRATYRVLGQTHWWARQFIHSARCSQGHFSDRHWNPVLLLPETRGLVGPLRWTSEKYLSRALKGQVCRAWNEPGLGTQTPLCSKPMSGAYLWPGPVTQ